MVDQATIGSIAGAGLVGDAKGWVLNLGLDDKMAQDLGVPHPFMFWFRPEPIRETLAVAYSKMAVMGMSHEYHSYQNTGSVPVDLELYVNRLMLLREGRIDGTNANTEQSGGVKTPDASGARLAALSRQIELGRRYLQALTMPPTSQVGVVGGSPSPCLLVLPGILELRMRVVNLVFTYSEVDLIGNITEMRVKCTFEESPLSRVTMQDVLDRGSFRTWGLL